MMTPKQREQRITERQNALQGREPVRVLHPRILAKVRRLPITEQIHFIEAMRVIDTLPKEVRAKRLLELLTPLFMRDDALRSECSSSQQTTDRERATEKT